MGPFSKQIEKCVFTHKLGQTYWYECDITDQWLIGQVTNGGISIAVAAHATSQHPLLQENGQTIPLSTSARYLRPIGVEKITIEVTVIKIGKTISIMQTNIYSGKKIALYVTLTMGILKQENNRMISVSDNKPITKSKIVSVSEKIFQVSGNYRKHIISTIDSPHQMAVTEDASVKPNDYNACFSGITGFIDDDITVMSLIALTDSMPPPIFNKVGTFGWIPTLELTVHIRALPIGKFDTVYYKTNTKYLGNNLMDEDFQLFNHDGMLLAESRQLSLSIMPIPHLDKLK